MAVYCVSYDLNKTGQNYKLLHEELQASEGYWHYLDSTWLVYTSESVEQLSERLRKAIDTNDRLLVIKVVQPSQGWLPEDAWEWITLHVGKA